MTLEDDIKKAVEEEEQSRDKYSIMAIEAETMGLHNMVGMMREMSNDEAKHIFMMRKMMSGMMGRALRVREMERENPGNPMMSQEEAEKLGMGEMHKRMMGSGVSSRPFPETYGDWVSLAEDIKAKMPQEKWGIVNSTLQLISEEHPNSGEAKRWLVEKAGELGIS